MFNVIAGNAFGLGTILLKLARAVFRFPQCSFSSRTTSQLIFLTRIFSDGKDISVTSEHITGQ